MKYGWMGVCAVLTGISTVTSAAFDPLNVLKQPDTAVCAGQPDTTQAIGLPDLISWGLCANPSLRGDYIAIQAAQASQGATRAEYVPSVTVTGTANRQQSRYQDDVWSKNHPYQAEATLSWLIYDFGGRSARAEQVAAYLDGASFDYKAAANDTILAITKSYFSILGYEEVLKSTKTSQASYKKSYEESKRRFEVGLAALSDKLLAQTSYEQSKLAVAEAENSLKKAKGDLARLLNLPPQTNLTLKNPLVDKDITRLNFSGTVEDMLSTALSLRPEIKSAVSALKAAEQEVNIQRAGALPSLSAKASGSFGDNWRYHNPYQYGSSVGVVLSVPLFTGFKDTYDIAKAGYQARQASEQVASVKDTVQNDVWHSYQDYVTSTENYQITGRMLASAEENERVAFASYQVGQGNILNLLTATSQLATARQEKIVAFYQVLINKSTLYRAMGRF